jgi:hypothetical protein
MLGIRSVKLRLYFFGGMLPVLLALLLIDLVPLSRAFVFSTTPRTFRGQRRQSRENHCNGAYPPIGIGISSLTPTTRGGEISLKRATTRTALYDNPDPNNNNQSGNDINKNEKNKNNKSKNKSANLGFQLDPSLLVPDLLGVAVACELLGLLDAVNDSSFLLKGGWLEPLGHAPTTLPLLISRFSTNSVFWIAACCGISTIINGNGTNDGLVSNDSNSNTKDSTSNAMASGQSAVGYALRIGAVFCLLRIVLALVVALAAAGATGWDSSTVAATDALLGVLRECYVVVLVTATTRYVVQALYY